MEITCYSYDTWQEAHKAHEHDFCVYMFDVLPIDELIHPDTKGYIGSAGANAKRTGESKTTHAYVKGSLGARYRGGSYTKNHTRSQDVSVLVVSRNTPQDGESMKEFYQRANTPGYKYEERSFLGFLENKLHEKAVQLDLTLNNAEKPKCLVMEDYNRDFFNQVAFVGDIPAIIDVAQDSMTLEDYRGLQKDQAIIFHQEQLNLLLAA